MIKLQTNFYEGKDVGYSQYFGENPKDYAKFGLKGHNGIDIPIPTGTNLYSSIEGVVTEHASDPTGYGNYIKIENDECAILYAHLKSSPLVQGQKVKAGEFVGFSNNTGNSTGPHLHFAVHPKPRNRANGYNGYIDPLGKDIEWVVPLEGSTECEKHKKQVEYERGEKEKYKREARNTRAKIVELDMELIGLESYINKQNEEIKKLKAEKKKELKEYSKQELLKALFS